MDETWHPTTYRTHTLGDIQRKGADLVGQEVTVAGFCMPAEVRVPSASLTFATARA